MRCHQMCRPEPNRERQLGPMHHSPSCHAGLLAAGNTLMGIGAAPQQVTPLPTAPRTNEAIRPAALKQELGAMRFVRKPLLKCEERVRNGHRPRSCPVGGSESNQTWDNGISLSPRSDRISRVPPYSWTSSALPVRDCHPLWPDFPDGSGYLDEAAGLVRVRSPLLAESRLMSFPPAT